MSQVHLSWTARAGDVDVAGYLVERQDQGSTSFEQVGTSTGTSYNDTGLAAGSTYSYRVRAMNAARKPERILRRVECGDRFAYDRSSQIALNEDGSWRKSFKWPIPIGQQHRSVSDNRRQG